MLKTNHAKRLLPYMKTPYTKSHILAIFAVILTMLISSCNFFGREEVKFFPTRYFLIEPQTLLESIEQNKANLFTPVDDMPPDNNQHITVNWEQSDYTKILTTLFTTVLQDDINDWRPDGISLSLMCGQYNQGFQGGYFTFFKNLKESQDEIRMVRIVNITAWDKTISVADKEYRPKLVNWSSLDLAKTKITADDALKIAERTGGRDTRLAVENNCNINVAFISGSPRYEGWWVRYVPFDANGQPSGILLEFDIDPMTGKPGKK